jgi:hypothetical protein
MFLSIHTLSLGDKMQYHQNTITVSQQFQALRQHSLTLSGAGTLGIGRFNFRYYAQPTPISRQYLIEISYRHYKRPNVYVIEPDLLALTDGRKLPHVYQQDPPDLCLYMPNTGEWSPEKWISKTIVPWSFVWLYYYENWLATDHWAGGGEHPGRETRRQRLLKKKSGRRR